MAFKPGWPELLIVLVIIVLLFGPGRVSKMAGELAKGIRSFREGLKDPEEERKAAEKAVDHSGESTPDSTDKKA